MGAKEVKQRVDNPAYAAAQCDQDSAKVKVHDEKIEDLETTVYGGQKNRGRGLINEIDYVKSKVTKVETTTAQILKLVQNGNGNGNGVPKTKIQKYEPYLHKSVTYLGGGSMIVGGGFVVKFLYSHKEMALRIFEAILNK